MPKPIFTTTQLQDVIAGMVLHPEYSHEDMKNAIKQKEQAMSVHITNNINVVGDMRDNSTVSNQNVSIKIDVEKVQAFVTQIEENTKSLPEDIRELVLNEISAIKGELGKNDDKRDESKIAKSLKAIKNICESVVGNFVASGIASQIPQLL